MTAHRAAPTLKDLGWTPRLEEAFKPFALRGLLPARVIAEHRMACDLVCDRGEFTAEVSGNFRKAAGSKADFPAVGDWAAIAFNPAARRQTIHGLLARRTRLSRKDPGGEDEQVIAANIDTVFIVIGLDGDYNLKRIGRYLAAACSGGAEAVVILNKADLAGDAALKAKEIDTLGFGARTLALDSINLKGYEALAAHIGPARTIVFSGSSGAGKSTIINNLLGRTAQLTSAVRAADSKGRHTTTGRRMFVLPGSGALLIDTPGMRGLELWAGEKTVDGAFEDIRALAAQCRFGNCSHANEPACAVREAMVAGKLDKTHFDNYLKIRAEAAALKARMEIAERLKNKTGGKRGHKTLKDILGKRDGKRKT
ncbi:MAG: ribosome small subunit-dependent GTPase A [Elusimicrobia bacterium CG_4_10_14_0_2_um_filter_56_8]|nr:MAG: ribosome small subunit-dependent GTPase A [Elusimicrobia bacterium CG_4_10_14_0_2_um_filter_56_8]